ncbi:hypothetical protein [Streptomyces sp. Caat 7-52]|uniref:hypothetical protein n=1 Tax=Streptomyces sp. Caat 7-52 TaxID=2949637 RepID=UPI0020359DB9|nr:hypothetical protein [Streptomyces sp. Caat 7-52]
MISGKKIAAVSGLVGGLVMTCAGITHANTGSGPGTCVSDLLGGFSCTQRIEGEVPEDGFVPHQENCKPVQPVTIPAPLGGTGVTRLGPEVTCNPTTVGVPPEPDDEQGAPGLLP